MPRWAKTGLRGRSVCADMCRENKKNHHRGGETARIIERRINTEATENTEKEGKRKALHAATSPSLGPLRALCFKPFFSPLCGNIGGKRRTGA